MNKPQPIEPPKSRWPGHGVGVLIIHLIAISALWRLGDWTRSTDVLMGWALGCYFMLWEQNRRS